MAKLHLRKNVFVLTRNYGMLRIVYVDRCNPYNPRYLGRNFANDVSYNFDINDVSQVITLNEFTNGKLEE